MSTQLVVVQEIVVKTVRMEDGAVERRDRLLAIPACLACERPLEKDAAGNVCETVTIGQCDGCYRAQLRAEKAGVRKRRKTIAEGKALPNGVPGPKSSSKYAQQISQELAEAAR